MKFARLSIPFPATPQKLLPFLLAVMLHLIGVDWAKGHLDMPGKESLGLTATPIIAAIRITQPQLPEDSKPVAPAPLFRSPKKTTAIITPAEPNPIDEADITTTESTTQQNSEPTTSLLSTELAHEAPRLHKPFQQMGVPAPEPAIETSTTNREPQRYKIDLPPSAKLSYNVHAVRDGKNVYGKSTLNWHTNGQQYAIAGATNILFITLLDFNSEGTIEDTGIAPVLYQEKRIRRSTTNTHFQRERRIISFSASEATYPRIGDEQDRASVVWQLASIGRGDPSLFFTGSHIDLTVAGVRNAALWRFEILGEETIDVDGKRMSAWHLLRKPQTGTYEQILDVWLAPHYEWYPVRLRFTEVNGNTLDMMLSDIPAQAALN